jgi:tRNA(fMet)-specific endonuclease VapC
VVTARFLLDSNVLSEPLKPQPNPLVTKLLAQQAEVLSTAAVVYHELQYGCLIMPGSQRRQSILTYITETIGNGLPIFPYDLEAAKWHASERARLRKTGKTPPYLDGQIAAIAAVNRLILVTRNIADFENFQGIALENWHD